MTYRVDLAVQVEDALGQLPEEGRQEVMEVIAEALVQRGTWPEPGGWHGALHYGRRRWVAFTAYADGIEVYDVGWAG